MFFAVGAQLVWAAYFLLVTLGVAMATIVASTGSVILTCITQDLTQLGGLWARRPITGVSYLIGACALVGLPPLGSFWSIRTLLDGLWYAGDLRLVAVLLVTNAITAFSLMRMFGLMFLGPTQVMTARAPEPIWSVILPMMALAAMALHAPIILHSLALLPVGGIGSMGILLEVSTVLGGILGAERTFVDGVCRVKSLSWIQQAIQNAAGAAGAAGWWAVMLLLVLLFVDPEVRAKPRKIIDAMSQGGILISTLYLMFLAVSIIDFCLSFTGLPVFLSLDVLAWLNSLNLGGGGSDLFQLIALLMTMLLAVRLGMGMPAVPAYINAALLMGPVLAGLGLSLFTAHMFIFYFAVASAITPPVALAAFAAASITKAEPMATGLSAVKSGIVMFVVPFVFAFYPELLLITEAILDPRGAAGSYLPGYDGQVHLGALTLLLGRLVVALYLISSALSGYDRAPLAVWEIALRLLLAVLVLVSIDVVWIGALVASFAVIALNHRARAHAEAA